MSLWKYLLGEEYQESPIRSENQNSLADRLKQIIELQKSVLHAFEQFNPSLSSGSETPAHHHFAQYALNHGKLQVHINDFKNGILQTFDILNYATGQKGVSMDASTQQALTDMHTHKVCFKNHVHQLTLHPLTHQAILEMLKQIDTLTCELHQAFENCFKLTPKDRP